jgi:hypothetical protein
MPKFSKRALSSSFLTKTLYAPLPLSIHTTRPARLFLLEFDRSHILRVQIIKLFTVQFSPMPYYLSFLGQNIFLSTISLILSAYVPFSMSGAKWQTHMKNKSCTIPGIN